MELKETELSINNILIDFKNKKTNIEKIIKEFSKANELLKNPIENAFLISNWIKEFKKKFSENNYYQEISDLIESIEEKNKRNQEDFILDFGKKLKETFEKDNINIVGSGGNYVIGFFNIKIDFDKANAAIYFSRELIKSRIPLNAKNILVSYKAAETAIIKKSFDAREFIKSLYEAYKREIIINGLEIGKRINIIKVLKELAFLMQGSNFDNDPKKENYRTYSRAQFAYDLYRLKSENLFEYEDKKLNLGTATIDYAGKRQYSIYVPDDLSGGNYIMYISFIPK